MFERNFWVALLSIWTKIHVQHALLYAVDSASFLCAVRYFIWTSIVCLPGLLCVPCTVRHEFRLTWNSLCICRMYLSSMTAVQSGFTAVMHVERMFLSSKAAVLRVEWMFLSSMTAVLRVEWMSWAVWQLCCMKVTAQSGSPNLDTTMHISVSLLLGYVLSSVWTLQRMHPS